MARRSYGSRARSGSRRVRSNGSGARRMYAGSRRSAGKRRNASGSGARTLRIEVVQAAPAAPTMEAPAGYKVVPTKTAKF